MLIHFVLVVLCVWGVFFLSKIHFSLSLTFISLFSLFFSLFSLIPGHIAHRLVLADGVLVSRALLNLYSAYPVGWEVPCTKQIIVKYGILTRFQPVHATSKSIWRRFCDQSTYLIVYNNILCTCVINVRYCDLYPIVLLLTLETFYVNRVWSFER